MTSTRKHRRRFVGIVKPLIILIVLWLASRYMANGGLLLLIAALIVWKLTSSFSGRLARLVRVVRRAVQRVSRSSKRS